MRCDDVRALIALLREGPLAEDLRAAALRHLEGCAGCRALLDRRERLEALLRGALPVPDPGEEYFEGLRSRVLAASTPARRPYSAVRALAAAALAAAAVLMIALGPRLVRRAAPASPAPEISIARRIEPARPEGPPSTGSDRPAVPAKAPEAPKVETPVPAPPPALPADPPPGTAARQARMTGEAVEVALAETPAERVLALCSAAEAQLRDLQEAVAKDPALAAELAGAYRVLIADGVSGVLREKGEAEEELARARELAARRAREHESALAALSGGTSGPLRESLALAIEASRSISGR